MTEIAWTLVSNTLPPEGVLVEVITPAGDQRELIYANNLWWVPDRSMYCYFVPIFWREHQVQRAELAATLQRADWKLDTAIRERDAAQADLDRFDRASVAEQKS